MNLVDDAGLAEARAAAQLFAESVRSTVPCPEGYNLTTTRAIRCGAPHCFAREGAHEHLANLERAARVEHDAGEPRESEERLRLRRRGAVCWQWKEAAQEAALGSCAGEAALGRRNTRRARRA